MARGTVRVFDVRAGVGEVEGDDGRRLPFHCTALDDGTRTIDAGTAVEFEIVPGHFGRWEAGSITRT